MPTMTQSFALLALVPGFALTPGLAWAQPAAAPVIPILRAHAHNDYEHKRPLLDALDQGFRSVEADIYSTKDGLIVAHTPLGLKPERTLQKLYLDPLRERAKANGGAIYPKGPPFYLLIDVKTGAAATGPALAKVLEEYADILSVTRNGVFERTAVTVVVSGNCDRGGIMGQAVRYAGIDGRPADLDSKAPADLIPWVSASWASEFQWNGTGPFPEAERAKLKAVVGRAHARGRLVRFWAIPDKAEAWEELRAADVDLINTDKLAELRQFLLRADAKKDPR